MSVQSKKRIALLVPEYRTDAAPGGGVATVADFFYDSLIADPRLSVEVVSPRMFHRAGESQRLFAPMTWFNKPTVRQVEVAGKPVTYVGSHCAELEIFRFLPRARLTRILKQYGAVIVVSGTPASFLPTSRLGVPVIGQVATTVKQERVRFIQSGNIVRRAYSWLATQVTYALDRLGVRVPDLILVENEGMASWCRDRGHHDVRIILPGIDTSTFSPACPDSLIGNDTAGYLLSVGRLGDPRKDFSLLIEAYNHAVSHHGIAERLVIAGRGSLPPDVLRLISAYDLESRVEVRSDVTPEQLRDLYKRASLFVMSSSEEGLGMVLMEAMASGLPFVSTATAGASSIKAISGEGTTVQFGESMAARLGEAIHGILSDPTALAKHGVDARNAAEQHFDSTKLGARIREIVHTTVSSELQTGLS